MQWHDSDDDDSVDEDEVGEPTEASRENYVLDEHTHHREHLYPAAGPGGVAGGHEYPWLRRRPYTQGEGRPIDPVDLSDRHSIMIGFRKNHRIPPLSIPSFNALLAQDGPKARHPTTRQRLDELWPCTIRVGEGEEGPERLRSPTTIADRLAVRRRSFRENAVLDNALLEAIADGRAESLFNPEAHTYIADDVDAFPELFSSDDDGAAAAGAAGAAADDGDVSDADDDSGGGRSATSKSSGSSSRHSAASGDASGAAGEEGASWDYRRHASSSSSSSHRSSASGASASSDWLHSSSSSEDDPLLDVRARYATAVKPHIILLPPKPIYHGAAGGAAGDWAICKRYFRPPAPAVRAPDLDRTYFLSERRRSRSTKPQAPHAVEPEDDDCIDLEALAAKRRPRTRAPYLGYAAY